MLHRRPYQLRPLLGKNLEHTDLEFMCSGPNETLTAHRYIFGVCSPMLKQCFQSIEDEESVVILPGVQPSIVKKIVEFVYTGTVTFTSQAEKDELENTLRALDIHYTSFRSREEAEVNIEAQEAINIQINTESSYGQIESKDHFAKKTVVVFHDDFGEDEENDDIETVQPSLIGGTASINPGQSVLKAKQSSFKLSCDLCNILFNSRDVFERHKASHEVGNRGVKLELSCVFCDRSFTRKKDLTAHMLTHERPFKCDHCDKSFARKATLVIHTRIHTGERPEACDVCGKSFPSRSSLSVHKKQMHSKEKRKWNCDTCSMRFVTKAALEIHTRSHTKEKPWVCDTCGKGFSTKGNMLDHNRLHNDTNPFVCNKCGLHFKWKQSLVRHLIDHTGVRPYPCPKCDKAFKTADCLKKHTISVHSEVKMYVCQFCHGGFSTKSGMYRHQRKLSCSALKSSSLSFKSSCSGLETHKQQQLERVRPALPQPPPSTEDIFQTRSTDLHLLVREEEFFPS